MCHAIDMEPNKILSTFLSIKNDLEKPPKRKSNSAFKGHLFAKLLFHNIKEYISRQYALVEGPLWIHGIEWIEWDGAVIKNINNNSFSRYNPNDIVTLFEIKARGIYGGEKDARKALERIRDNFDLAKGHCPNLKQCIYVTLQERTPKRENSIDYFESTKKILEADYLAIALFTSPGKNEKPKPYPGEWDHLIEALKEL